MLNQVSNLFILNFNNMEEILLDFIKNEYLENENVELSVKTPLISSGLIDSFSMVSLLIFIEKKFNVRIPSKQATAIAFNTIEQIIDLIKKNKE